MIEAASERRASPSMPTSRLEDSSIQFTGEQQRRIHGELEQVVLLIGDCEADDVAIDRARHRAAIAARSLPRMRRRMELRRARGRMSSDVRRYRWRVRKA
jgi:DNA-binding SARP family transcriptional activator